MQGAVGSRTGKHLDKPADIGIFEGGVDFVEQAEGAGLVSAFSPPDSSITLCKRLPGRWATMSMPLSSGSDFDVDRGASLEGPATLDFNAAVDERGLEDGDRDVAALDATVEQSTNPARDKFSRRFLGRCAGRAACRAAPGLRPDAGLGTRRVRVTPPLLPPARPAPLPRASSRSPAPRSVPAPESASTRSRPSPPRGRARGPPSSRARSSR